MKEWTIYRIPNCTRIINGKEVIGKIGITSNPIQNRIKENKEAGLNTEGWLILGTVNGTMSEAMKHEFKYQTEFNCVDGHYAQRNIPKTGGGANGTSKNTGVKGNSKGSKKPLVSLALTGRKLTPEHIQNMKKPREYRITSCPICGTTGRESLITRWHGKEGEYCQKKYNTV